MNAIVEQLLAGEGREAGQADIILEAATWAAASFSRFRHEQVTTILRAAAAAAPSEAGRQEDFSTPRKAADDKRLKVPRPLGVVFASIPANAPVGAIVSTLHAVLATRNAIAIALHPEASAASLQAARAIAAAAEKAGAPACTLQVIEACAPALAHHLAKSTKVSRTLDTAVAPEALVTWSDIAVDGAPGVPSHPVLGREAPMSLGKLQEGAER